jgi:hypothetical protein
MKLILNRAFLRFSLQTRYSSFRVRALRASNSISLPGAGPLLGLLQRTSRTRRASVLDIMPRRGHARWIRVEGEDGGHYIRSQRRAKSMTRVLMFSKTRCVSPQQIVQYDSTTEHSVHRATLVRLFPTILNGLELVCEWWVRKRWVNDWNMVNMTLRASSRARISQREAAGIKRSRTFWCMEACGRVVVYCM